MSKQNQRNIHFLYGTEFLRSAPLSLSLYIYIYISNLSSSLHMLCMILACLPPPRFSPPSPLSLHLHVCAVVPAAAPQRSFCKTVGSPKLSRSQPLSVSYTVKFSATYGAIPITVGDKPRNNARSPPSSR